jgi:drug/metabolite transporter (DMT)-like permease
MAALLPYGIAFLAVTGYAALTVLARKAMLSSTPPFAFIAITMAVLCVLATAASLGFEKKFSLTELRWAEWRWFLLFGMVNFAAFTFFLMAMKTLPSAHYQLLFAITPVITAALAFLMLGETVQPKFFIGLALVGAGLYVALMK